MDRNRCETTALVFAGLSSKTNLFNLGAAESHRFMHGTNLHVFSRPRHVKLVQILMFELTFVNSRVPAPHVIDEFGVEVQTTYDIVASIRMSDSCFASENPSRIPISTTCGPHAHHVHREPRNKNIDALCCPMFRPCSQRTKQTKLRSCEKCQCEHHISCSVCCVLSFCGLKVHQVNIFAWSVCFCDSLCFRCLLFVCLKFRWDQLMDCAALPSKKFARSLSSHPCRSCSVVTLTSDPQKPSQRRSHKSVSPP